MNYEEEVRAMRISLYVPPPSPIMPLSFSISYSLSWIHAYGKNLTGMEYHENMDRGGRGGGYFENGKVERKRKG